MLGLIIAPYLHLIAILCFPWHATLTCPATPPPCSDTLLVALFFFSDLGSEDLLEQMEALTTVDAVATSIADVVRYNPVEISLRLYTDTGCVR